MKIIHYFLGFPPYRSGGLTKYCFDLMQTQVEHGDEVIALWPGEIKIFSKKVSIYKHKDINGIENYELINPLPVSLDEGISQIDAYIKPCDESIFIKFFEKIKPTVIHIHTLMGLYQEFIIAANKLHIRTVFTTHDYFGICPKVTLYRCGTTCEDDKKCFYCVICNQRALSLKKIKLMQSSLYRKMKNTTLVKNLRKRHRDMFFKNEILPENIFNRKQVKIKASKYRKLRGYYINMLSNIDMIHFNSTVAENIYKKYFKPKDSRTISITHRDIVDHRDSFKKESEKLRLTYLAPVKSFKGFSVIKEALDELWNEGNHNFILWIFGSVTVPSPYMKIRENGYLYNELSQIFSKTDVLLAPSIWYETFGFTVLEAISYGVPVIISDHVGAKDIVGNGGIIVKAGNIENLKEVIKSLTNKQVIQLRKNIQEHGTIKSWNQFVDENYTLYHR